MTGTIILPTNKSEIVKIDIQHGLIVERQPTERVLGNLICHGDYLISQGADGVFAYALRDRKRVTIAESMAKFPNDPEILEDYANLLASDGQRDEAISAIRRAIEYQPDPNRQDELQDSLVRIVINGLREDFAKYRHLASEARHCRRDLRSCGSMWPELWQKD